MKILRGHYSPETAYVVNDYPYGFTLRCKIRYWLEVNGKGTRFWSQTTNPKKQGEVWNKPKASVYMLFGAMYLDDDDHVQWGTLSPYAVTDVGEFFSKYKEGLTDRQVETCKFYISKLAERDLKFKEV